MRLLSKLLFILTLFITIIYSFSVTVNAETCGDLTYEVFNGEVTIVKCSESATNVVIPGEIEGNPVICIGEGAFENCTSLISLEIPNSIKVIEEYSLYGCCSLEELKIPFVGSEMENNGTYDAVFGYLFGYTVSQSVSEGSGMGSGMGSGTGSGFVNSEVAVNNVSVPSTKYFDKTFQFSDKSSGDKYYYYIPKSLKLVIITGDTIIPDFAFYNCEYLTHIVVSDKVTHIGDNAFYNCDRLSQIAIGAGVTTLGTDVFKNCLSLSSIEVSQNNLHYASDDRGVLFNKNKTILMNYPIGNSETSYVIPDTVTDIDSFSFETCKCLEVISIPDGVVKIGECSFYDCDALKKVIIPKSISSIGKQAFGMCNGLESIVVDENNYLFSSDEHGILFDKNKQILICCPSGNKLTDYVVPDSVSIISDYAFKDCRNLNSVVISNSITTIGDFSFNFCDNLSSITLGAGVTHIGKSAFSFCTDLENITIPECVTSIGDDAFSVCVNLTSLNINSITGWCNINFGNTSSNPMCYANEVYLNGTLLTNLDIPEEVTSVGDYAFYCCDSIESIDIGENVVRIGVLAFGSCENLISVDFGKNITSIGNSAFSNCPKISNIIIPDSVKVIGESCFEKCSGIVSADFTNASTQVADKAFYNCESLVSLTFGNGASSIGKFAFAKCSKLKNVSLGEGLTIIDDGAFDSCKCLTSIIIPDSVVNMGDGVFTFCSNLKEIALPFVGSKRGSNGTYDSVFGYIFGGIYEEHEENGVLMYNISIDMSDLFAKHTKQMYSNGKFACYLVPASLKRMTITDEEEIPFGAFYGCDSLESITFSDSLKHISSDAFNACTSIAKVYYIGTEEQWSEVLISDYNDSLTTSEIIFLKKEIKCLLPKFSSDVESAIALCAIYGENGVFVGFEDKMVTAEETEISFVVDTRTADSYKIILLDTLRNLKPLCESVQDKV